MALGLKSGRLESSGLCLVGTEDPWTTYVSEYSDVWPSGAGVLPASAQHDRLAWTEQVCIGVPFKRTMRTQWASIIFRESKHGNNKLLFMAVVPP